MPKIRSYGTVTPYNSDFIIGTDRDISNVTRNYKVSKIVDIILASLGIGTVTSIATTSGTFVSVTGGTITTAGTITMDISATGTPGTTTFLRGDGTWSEPGPAPTTVIGRYNSNLLTSDIDSLNFTGAGVSGTASDQDVLIIIPGDGSVVDSVIAGTGISVSGPTGNVTITNTGVTQARAGGNVTLSGGTGAVTVSTTANAGTVSSVSPGLGIDTIANNTTNPNIDVEYTGANNIVDVSESIVTASGDDFVEFNQLTSSNVKSARLRDINEDMLTLVKQTIDDADLNKVKNTEPSGFTTTAGANNIVTLTITEYQAIPVKDPNTLYLIIGAGTSFTVNPSIVDNITGGTLGVDYTISTSPTSFTGINGASYTFTTTVNPGSGTFTGTNPVVTTDNVVNSSGNPYNRSITVSGTWTAPTSNSVRAKLATIALDQDSSGSIGTSNLNANLSNLTFGGNVVNDVDPPSYSTANPTSYSFASTVSITDTNTYEFTVGPTVIDAAGTLTPTTPNQDVNVTTYMHGTVALKTYTVDLAVTNSVSVTGAGAGTPTYNMDFISTGSQVQSSSISQAGGTISNAITGLNQSGTFGFSLNNLDWPLPTYYSWSVSPSLTIDSNSSPINGANGTVAVTVNGTILYEAPPPDQYRKLNATSVITAAISGIANGTINDAVQGPVNGTAGTYTYTVPTVTANTGYVLTGGVVTLAANPVTFNSTGGQSGLGTLVSPLIENDPTVTAGTITQISANLSQSQLAPASNISYNTSYFAQGGGSSTNVTTSGTNGSNTGTLTIGNGTVNATVSKTAPSNQASGSGVITWNYKPSGGAFTTVNTYTFNSGTYVYSSYTYTGVSNGDELKTIITEN